MAELVGAPIELVVIEFPGSQFNGEILPSIAQLIDDGIVTLLDALLVTKDDDGTVVSLEISDLGDDEQASFDQLDGEVGGLLSDSDVEAVGESLSPGSSALLLVWEDTWAGRGHRRGRSARAVDSSPTTASTPRPCAWRSPKRTNCHRHEQIRTAKAGTRDDEARNRPSRPPRRGRHRGENPPSSPAPRRLSSAGCPPTARPSSSKRRTLRPTSSSSRTLPMQAAAQQAVAEQQAAAPPPPPAAPAAPDSVAELERLAQLKAQGVLSDEEFTAAKAKLLGL